MANENKNYRGFTKEDLVNGLTDVSIPLDISGAIFMMDTPTLGSQLMSLIDESFKISEIDHIYIYPKYEQGQITDFGLTMYFLANKNGTGDISRLSGGQKRNNRGSLDLSAFINNKTSSGGFKISDKFKTCIGTLSNLDKEGNIIIRADKDMPQLAVVEGDFFKIMALALKIDESSPYDFVITDCQPINNSKNCCDYRMKIMKEIQPVKKKSKRSSINYDYRDRAFAQNAKGGRH